MLVAYDKQQKQYVNDFQSSATKEVLLKNAVSLGHKQEDIEFRDITQEELDSILAPMIAAEKQKQEDAQAELDIKAQALKEKLSLTDDDVSTLRSMLGIG